MDESASVGPGGTATQSKRLMGEIPLAPNQLSWLRSEHRRLRRPLHVLAGLLLPLGVIGATLLLASTPAEGAGASTIAPGASTTSAPTITSPPGVYWGFGAPRTFQVTATGSPPPTFSEQGPLPEGITLSPQGLLSGTPTQAEGGSYPITITATNSSSSTSQHFVLIINVPAGLNEGQTLQPGDVLIDGPYRLVMQGDGNLVEYVTNSPAQPYGPLASPQYPTYAVWSSGTWGHPGAYAVMQGDGNFVVYSSAGVALWSSGTSGHPGASAYLWINGDLTVRGAENGLPVLYQTTSISAPTLRPPGTSTIKAGQGLTDGIEVTTGAYTLIMQTDGNLVVYGPSGAMWSSGTWGHPGAYAVMQGDGNFVVYTPSGHPLYWTGTNGNPGAFVTLWYNGALIVWSAQGVPIWGS